jgi:hypothetical protein
LSPYSPQNPYALASATVAPVGPVRGHHPVLKWLYLVAALATFGFYVAMNVAQFSFIFEHLSMRTGGKPPHPLLEDPTTQIFFGVYMFTAITMSVIGLVWLGLAWAALPEQYRVTKSGKRMSPGLVVGLMFVPCFSIYWMFPANLGLCDAVDYLLEHYGSPKRAPRGLALAACICYIVPCTTILVAPILFFIFMWQMDALMKEILPRLEADAVRV